jgi:hypothetical protein
MKGETEYRAAAEQPDAHGAIEELACFLYRKKDRNNFMAMHWG